MKINPTIFRGYDIRGVVGTDLSPEVVEHLGKAYGTFLKRRGIGRAVVGRDSRQTSLAYSEAMTKGLLACGIDVIDIGMNFVGTFYWSQYFLDTKGGAFITASHNPPEFNGMKLASGFSETLVSDGIQELKKLTIEESYDLSSKPGRFEKRNIREDYFKDILKRVPLSKKFKVLIDPSATTGGEIVPAILRRAGLEVIEKNCQVDSSFPLGIADPTELRVAERLGREVTESGADVGFSYDADGDRIGIVDKKGQVIWNDVLLELFAKETLREHPGATIMFNTLCSKAVEETILQSGGKSFMWRTGHSFLKKKNQDVKAAFIGELSGHFFFSADFYNHDDGIYSTMRLLKFLGTSGLSLSEAVAQLPHYISSPEIKLFCPEDKKAALTKEISPMLKRDFPQAKIIDDERAGDGVRFETEDSMFVVRYSQNGPYLTVKYESKTTESYQGLKNYIGTLLHKFPEIDWTSKINVNTEALE